MTRIPKCVAVNMKWFSWFKWVTWIASLLGFDVRVVNKIEPFGNANLFWGATAVAIVHKTLVRNLNLCFFLWFALRNVEFDDGGKIIDTWVGTGEKMKQKCRFIKSWWRDESVAVDVDNFYAQGFWPCCEQRKLRDKNAFWQILEIFRFL